MRWNPFLSKRGRMVAAVLFAGFVPTGYLASYPLAYLVLVGADANNVESIPFLELCCVCPAPSQARRDRWEMWQRMNRYCFPPAEWLMDHTPLRVPMLALARVLDTDEQLEGGIRSREWLVRLKMVQSTGRREDVIAFLNDEIAEYELEHARAEEERNASLSP